MKDIQFVIDADQPSTGVDRQSSVIARELVEWLRAELHVAPRVSTERPPGVPAPTVVTRDPSLLDLIVAIPSFIVAVDKAADVLQAKARLRRLTAWLRSRRYRITLRTTLGKLELPGDDDRGIDELVDRLSRRDEL